MHATHVLGDLQSRLLAIFKDFGDPQGGSKIAESRKTAFRKLFEKRIEKFFFSKLALRPTARPRMWKEKTVKKALTMKNVQKIIFEKKNCEKNLAPNLTPTP